MIDDGRGNKQISGRRYVPLDEIHTLMGELAPTMNTLERWCRTGKWPAKRKGGRGRPWVVDLRAFKLDLLKGGRDFYEEMVESVHSAANE